MKITNEKSRITIKYTLILSPNYIYLQVSSFSITDTISKVTLSTINVCSKTFIFLWLLLLMFMFRLLIIKVRHDNLDRYTIYVKCKEVK